MSEKNHIAHVALPVPLDKLFDYKMPPNASAVVGVRVKVPFGRQHLIGIIEKIDNETSFTEKKLKYIDLILDEKPVWDALLQRLLKWASAYYHYPIGKALMDLLPAHLRKGETTQRAQVQLYKLTEKGKEQPFTKFTRAIKQARVLRLLSQGPLSKLDLQEQEISPSVLKTLVEKQWIEKISQAPQDIHWHQDYQITEEKFVLNTEQAIAVSVINQHLDSQSDEGFATFLLEGVTGSGKTEVYLNTVEKVLSQGKQVLILVPEISLTPQTMARVRKRFNVPMAMLHSGMTDVQRLQVWLDARDNQIALVLGTRSALFVPFDNLGLIIVDEEHDLSYKQQDGFKYHARDLAVLRANFAHIPIVLGSATPSIESIYNAENGKYHYLQLTQRAGNAKQAQAYCLDVKGLYLKSGLSAPLIANMRRHIEQGNQVMLFLNRRGYSPSIICHECGWVATCPRCDIPYTFHKQTHTVNCHHCGSQHSIPVQCGDCGSTQLQTVGVGTEQLEEQLALLFPDVKSVRIDQDSTRKKGQLERLLKGIRENEYQILIGTQLLAKGHHFPNVTLVALIDVDASLFSSDFRAAEKLSQLFVQVSGRAGRSSKMGEVVLQTHHPEHPLLQSLLHQGYQKLSRELLIERKQTQLPPYTSLAMLGAEANNSGVVEQFLQQVRDILQSHPLYSASQVPILGPLPAPISKRSGRYRWQLLLQTPNRTMMKQLIDSAYSSIALLPLSKKIKWSWDIDPQDLS